MKVILLISFFVVFIGLDLFGIPTVKEEKCSVLLCEFLNSSSCQSKGHPGEEAVETGMRLGLSYFFGKGNFRIQKAIVSDAILREVREGKVRVYSKINQSLGIEIKNPEIIVFGNVRCTDKPQSYDLDLTVYCSQQDRDGPCIFHFSFSVKDYWVVSIRSMSLEQPIKDRLIGYYPAFLASMIYGNSDYRDLVNSLSSLEGIEEPNEKVVTSPIRLMANNDCEEFESHGYLELRIDTQIIEVPIPLNLFENYAHIIDGGTQTNWNLQKENSYFNDEKNFQVNRIDSMIITINGVVRECNSNNRPIPDVYIQFRGLNPVKSDSNGCFSLYLLNKEIGEDIFLESVKKQGYEVVNEHDLNSLIIPGSLKLDVDIVLASEGYVESTAEKYYEISKKALLAEKRNLLTTLQEERGAFKLTDQEFQDSVAQVDADFCKQNEWLPQLSKRFARTNFDAANLTTKTAFSLFKAGKIGGAIQLLELGDPDRFLAVRSEKMYLIERVDSFVKFTTEKDIAVAAASLRKSLTLYPEDIDLLIASEIFFREKNYYAASIRNNERIIANNNAFLLQVGKAYTNIGKVQLERKNFNEAEKAFNASLKIYKQLYSQKSSAESYNNEINYLERIVKIISTIRQAETSFSHVEAAPETIIYIPDVITPNGDGRNDTWQILVPKTLDPRAYALSVFTHSGLKVHELTPLNQDWGAEGLLDGVYWWVLIEKGEEEAIKSGRVIIKRKN